MRPARDVLERLFEGSPRFVDQLAGEDVANWAEVFDRARQIALTGPEDAQVELLNAHPRIGAVPASVSVMSYREQGYDRDAGTAALQARLDQLNDVYEERFGFRFVVFVNGRSRAEIADIIEKHIAAPRAAELRRALSDIVAIARDRATQMKLEGTDE